MIFRPVSILPEEECLVVTGEVEHIFEGGPYDVVFRLRNDPKRYYINRGLENGLDLQVLKNELLGKEVTLTYPDHWTPLDPKKTTIHISKVEFGNVIVYSEFPEHLLHTPEPNAK